jgi:hypothetical protein
MIPKTHATLIFVLSVVLVTIMYFVEESTYSLAPLLSWSELKMFGFFVVMNNAVPLGLYANALEIIQKEITRYGPCGICPDCEFDCLEFGFLNQLSS